MDSINELLNDPVGVVVLLLFAGIFLVGAMFVALLIHEDRLLLTSDEMSNEMDKPCM